jgi:hypothetical protein
MNLTEQEIAKIAGRAAAQEMNRLQDRRKQEMRDARFQNVKLLMKNYRDFNATCENAVTRVQDSDECIDFEALMNPLKDPDEFVESIKRSAVHTKIMVEHVNAMLRVYKHIVTSCGSPEDLRKFDTLYYLYVADEPLNMDEIAALHHVDVRTSWRDLDAAHERAAALLFGANWVFQ